MILIETPAPTESKPAAADLEPAASGELIFSPHSSYSKASVLYAQSAVAIYGDADYGYIIIRASWGRFAFVSFRFGLYETSKPFRSRAAAIIGAYVDCDNYLSERSWAVGLMEDGLKHIPLSSVMKSLAAKQRARRIAP